MVIKIGDTRYILTAAELIVDCCTTLAPSTRAAPTPLPAMKLVAEDGNNVFDVTPIKHDVYFFSIHHWRRTLGPVWYPLGFYATSNNVTY